MATSLRRVLTGRGGSGKSTFGRYLCLCMAGEALGRSEADLDRLNAGCEGLDRRLHTWPHGPKLPFFVELRRFVQSEHFPEKGNGGEAAHLVAYLSGLGPAGVDLGPLVLHSLGEDGGTRVLLVLDGLDEVPTAAEARDRLKQVICRFVRVYPGCRVLLTSRPYAYAPGREWRLDESGFGAEALAPFDGAKIQRFVEEAYASFAARHRIDGDRAEELAADLLEQLRSNPSLRPLAEQPLMLTMMADLHSQKNGRLPGGRAALFEESVVLLFDRWNERRGQTTAAELAGMDEEQIRDALELLAFRAHRDGGEGTDQAADIEEAALVLALHDTRKRYGLKEQYSPEEIRDHLNQRSGILIAESPTVYRFPHRFFQEYLAACHLDRRYPRHLEDCLAAGGQLWREVLLFLAARASHTDRIWHLLRQMVPGPPPEDLKADDPRFVPLLYAALVILEHRLWERREHDQCSPLEDIRLWLRRAVELGALEPVDRVRLGQALGRLGDDRPGVGLRPDGMPGIEWVEIPEDMFWVSENDKSEGDERYEVMHAPFRIARYLVTNAQYQAFVDDGGYTEALRECWSDEGWEWKEGQQGPEDYGTEVFLLPNHPRVGISWFEAEAFCRWLGWRLGQDIRLPTEAQWERAVRGTDGRTYPWGDHFESSLCNADATGIGFTSAVGLFPDGESPAGRNGIGVLDGAGNVWEWCFDHGAGGGYPEGPRTEPSGPEEGSRRVLRGGSWASLARHVRAAYRDWGPPGGRDSRLGFRLSSGPERAEPRNRESGPAPGSARRGTRRREPGRGSDGP
ncbi:MAG: SUMF1/EgtB/PvdO family nonheme iron enzyme [Holophagales bacterium]|nr:SUMF1/EgtB/PvdO family nonheme iron enzyme [Holophagales bacterium]